MTLTIQQKAKLASHVWQGPGYVTFALLDGAGIPDLLDRLYGTDALEFECLYSGELEPSVAEVAPYIARLERGSDFASWVLGDWGASRGIFAQVTEDVGLPQLRRHFRKLNMVYRDDGRPVLFRYYDPRVMFQFLPLCNEAQLKEMFGPVSRYIVERGPSGAGAALSAPGRELVQEMFE
ncbi:DUF4123 domain-containing protein [Massilia horti]|uniref:DUF4123 domain-containing protein n=1 Tax=Massilia horti TaxID=2562153 RepID=A0A4Y9T8E9_9BURK|nr:DUF4123 domain-containing protein [Massilia horti]TFW33899.1 DUF4123 domain-containing protein [Massilia horti]